MASGLTAPAGPSQARRRRAAARPAHAVAVRISLIGKAAEFLPLALLFTVVPRILGPPAYGTFALVLAVVTIGSASLSLGGYSVLARFVPAATPETRAGVARALATLLLRRRLLQIAVIGAAAIGVSAATERHDAGVVAVVAGALALDLLATLAFQAALGLGGSRLFSFRYVFQNSVLVVGVLAIAPFDRDLAYLAVPVASAAALAVALAASLPVLARAVRGANIPSGALRFGAYEGVSGVLLQIMERGGIVAVALLTHSRTETGFSALAIGATLSLLYVVTQAFAVQLPALAELAPTRLAEAEAAVARLARNAQIVLVPVALLAAFALDHGVDLVLGQRFRDSAAAFGPALAMLPLAPVYYVAAQNALLRVRPSARFFASALGTAAFLATCLAAIPTWKAAGASFALLVGMLATLLTLTALLPRPYDLRLLVSGLLGSAAVLGVSWL